jgi:Tol biopolymer transport system component
VIEVVPAGGGTPVPVSDQESFNTSPVWLPHHSAILFISNKDGVRDIYQLSISQSGKPAAAPVRITTGLNPDRITISADGKRLAWSLYSETANVWTVPIPPRDSVPASTATLVTSGDQNIEVATVSRDGKWLYYDSDISGNSDIWRLPLAGGAGAGRPEQLTTDPANDFDPSVSPNGREVAFHSFRTGNRDIFVIPSSGGPAVQVTASPVHDWNARWSPDGQSLVFDQQTRADSTLWVVRRNPDGHWDTPQPLPHRGYAGLAVWSPDGRLIAFNFRNGVMVFNLATGQERVVSRTSTGAWAAWSGDGRTIYYADVDSLRGFIVRSVSAEGGRTRTLVYANSPDQLHRYGFSASNDRFFFPLIQRKADVWVAEVEPK